MQIWDLPEFFFRDKEMLPFVETSQTFIHVIKGRIRVAFILCDHNELNEIANCPKNFVVNQPCNCPKVHPHHVLLFMTLPCFDFGNPLIETFETGPWKHLLKAL